MGSMPRLKIKDEIRYRKGSTNEAVNCRACGNFLPGRYRYVRAGEDVAEDRCQVIGLHSGRRYRVRPDYTCDLQEMSLAYQDELYKMRAPISERVKEARRCRVCGCTDDDCRGCIERTGEPCYWVEDDLCSACAGEDCREPADHSDDPCPCGDPDCGRPFGHP